MSDAENLRHRANRLLALAQRARDDDCIKLAENIMERATQLFDEAIIQEQRSAPAPAKKEAPITWRGARGFKFCSHMGGTVTVHPPLSYAHPVR
jgi:hypothetical protein